MIVEGSNNGGFPTDSYNSFLTGIGSSIQMVGRAGSGTAANAETINGIFGDLTVGTSSYFSGGTSAYEATFGTVVATESIGAVPVPAAVWLFGSGLLGLVGVARRKKA